jgi:16S rRNA (guanine966-N2)-methyltransferase
MRIGAGRFRNAPLPAAGPGVRPVPGRLRTSLFSVLETRVPGARVLDLCAGVGALGFEALSRGAKSLVLVDDDRAAVAALLRFIERRGLAREALAVLADARRGGWPRGPYDLVFLDPPFRVWEGDAAAARPFLSRAAADLAPGGALAVKVPSEAPLPEDPSLQLLTRRAQGEVGYAILLPAPPPGRVPPIGV